MTHINDDLPVWEPGMQGLGPHACPICKSCGTATYMVDHIVSEHFDTREGKLLIADDTELTDPKLAAMGYGLAAIISHQVKRPTDDTPTSELVEGWDDMDMEARAAAVCDRMLGEPMQPHLPVQVRQDTRLKKMLERDIGGEWEVTLGVPYRDPITGDQLSAIDLSAISAVMRTPPPPERVLLTISSQPV